MTPDSVTYIHWGNNKFDPNRFVPVRNDYCLNKPRGGFWASPTSTDYGWREWCADEDYPVRYTEDDYFVFTLDPRANVLHIRTLEEVRALPRQDGTHCASQAVSLDLKHPAPPVDFVRLARMGYDAVEAHISDGDRVRGSLSGWDMDSLVVLNPAVIRSTDSTERRTMWSTIYWRLARTISRLKLYKSF